MNVIGYIKKNQDDIKTTPLNIIDALVISWVAYFDFSIVKDRLPLKISDFAYIPEYQKLEPYYFSYFPRFSRRYLNRMINSERFKDAKVVDYEYILDRKKGIQFAVVAVKFKNQIIIAVRGTDPSYAGWKEDFTLSYSDRMHSYAYAEEFIKRVIKRHSKERLILCGHSKGGNICTYLLSQLEDVSHIEHVYSFDGPGFRIKGLFKGKEDRLEKFTKIVPQSSIVGVLFSNETDVKIIKSRAVMFLQHNPFEWIIKDNDFVYLTKRTMSSRYLEKSLNGWIESLNAEDRERFTEIIFGELEKFEADDFVVFFKKLLLQFGPIYKAYRGLSKDDKKLVMRVVKKLIRNMVKPEKKKLIA